MTREGCITRSSASMRRITASSQTWVRQARMMPFARCSGASACSECSSSRISPETSSHLQVPQLPAWHENGKATPARSSASSIVSPARTGMLLLIDANPGVTQGRLAHAVGLDRSTMVGVVDTLEERGLIERRRGEDRRTNGLWLTRSGRTLLARLKRRIEFHERRVAARLNAGERAQLLVLLEKLSA